MTEILTKISKSINFKKYSDASFWTASGGSEINETMWFLLLSAIIVLLGLITFVISILFIKDSPPKKKLLLPFSWILMVIGITGAALGFFRIQGVEFFSAYAFWVLMILSLIGVVGYFGFRYIRYLPKEQVRYESYKIKKKYLPKRKKRS